MSVYNSGHPREIFGSAFIKTFAVACLTDFYATENCEIKLHSYALSPFGIMIDKPASYL
jgi:hypothetical protein